MTLLCTIDSKPVPEERTKRKGYAAVTCSDECYAEFRRRKKRPTKGYRVTKTEFAAVMKLRRAAAKTTAQEQQAEN